MPESIKTWKHIFAFVLHVHVFLSAICIILDTLCFFSRLVWTHPYVTQRSGLMRFFAGMFLRSFLYISLKNSLCPCIPKHGWFICREHSSAQNVQLWLQPIHTAWKLIIPHTSFLFPPRDCKDPNLLPVEYWDVGWKLTSKAKVTNSDKMYSLPWTHYKFLWIKTSTTKKQVNYKYITVKFVSRLMYFHKTNELQTGAGFMQNNKARITD